MSQLENIKTPLDLRTELHKMVVADLLGPAGGKDETVDEQNVRSRYMVGLLVPKGFLKKSKSARMGKWGCCEDFPLYLQQCERTRQ
jgi:hypothetical protein